MGPRERGEGQHLGLGVGHQRCDFGESGAELGGDFVPGVAHSAGVGLREDGSEHRGGHVLVSLGHQSEQVADEVHSAALAPGTLQGPVRGGAEPGVSVGYHQAHPGEPSDSQRAQEVLPEGLALAVADVGTVPQIGGSSS